jgi:hypothetical protein
MPAVLPASALSDHQYQLPEQPTRAELVDRMYDSVIILSGDALRSLETHASGVIGVSMRAVVCSDSERDRSASVARGC